MLVCVLVCGVEGWGGSRQRGTTSKHQAGLGGHPEQQACRCLALRSSRAQAAAGSATHDHGEGIGKDLQAAARQGAACVGLESLLVGKHGQGLAGSLEKPSCWAGRQEVGQLCRVSGPALPALSATRARPAQPSTHHVAKRPENAPHFVAALPPAQRAVHVACTHEHSGKLRKASAATHDALAPEDPTHTKLPRKPLLCLHAAAGQPRAQPPSQPAAATHRLPLCRWRGRGRWRSSQRTWPWPPPRPPSSRPCWASG